MMSSLLHRRQILSGAATAITLLGATTTGFALEAGNVAVGELMAPQPLPDLPIGDLKAPIVCVEYASLTCSHCAHFSVETFPVFKKDYIDTGKVLYMLREFPLDPLSTAAFMLARAAGDDKRNAMVEMLFARQKDWAFVEKPVEALANVVKAAGMTQEQFEKALSDKDLYAKVSAEKDVAADKFKIDATPTFFINGRRNPGAFSADELEKIMKP